MNAAALLPIFLTGLLGSVHCVGMCGGIVGALSAARPRQRHPPQAVQVIAIMPLPAPSPAVRVAAYNAGRIGSYAVAGAIFGGASQAAATLLQVAAIQGTLYWLANLMVVALGLYLSDLWRGLSHLEAAGQVLWRHIRPLLGPLLPMDTPWRAFALGSLWGWLPCGMVYSVLLTAMLSGSAASGALVMAAFGLGTLPMLFGLGMAGQRMRALMQKRGVRLACGLLVLGFGVLGLVRAWHGAPLGWLDMLCLTPQPAA
jgi:sulfite exporter TauE/SafE